LKKSRKSFITTEAQHNAMRWCLKNNIKVSVLPTKQGLKIEVSKNGHVTISPDTYENYAAQNKCWELYLYIYKKLN
jgi:hypothetical protein